MSGTHSYLTFTPMASVINSLSKSLSQVPASAIPAILDCIVSSTNMSFSSLFTSLLDSFPHIVKDIVKEDKMLASDNCRQLTSLAAALCYLLKEIGSNIDDLRSFLRRSFIPLLKVIHTFEFDMLDQIMDLVIDATGEVDSWVVVETTLVPFLIRSIGLSMGMLHNELPDISEWTSCSISTDSSNLVVDSPAENELIVCASCVSLTISCRILSLILEAAVKRWESVTTSHPLTGKGCHTEDMYICNFIYDLSNMIERMLLYSVEHRSSAIRFLLPAIFKAFASGHSFGVSVREQKKTVSWGSFFCRIWSHCKTLLSLGSLERRDAYNILSLYFSALPTSEESENADVSERMQEFNIKAETEFWDEIRRGLVHREGLVRKQCLHILKLALQLGEQLYSDSHVSVSRNHSLTHGKTKRELWADKEAKSLGVGKFFNAENLFLNSKHYWEAFVLLYEMLEEYGTHLVEAAWNHQVSLLLQSSISNVNFVSPTGKIYKNQMEIYVEVFNWLSILWQRGFCHDNPQVRCLIMQSFLDMNWKSYGHCVGSVPESFIVGPFLGGLNDPIHHKDFGVKGVYMSRTIELAASFIHQFTSSLAPMQQLIFMCNLTSSAKNHSFGRAGLMCLAECTASAAAGVRSPNNVETNTFKAKSPDNVLMESLSGVPALHEKTELLDALRFVIDCSKQHFNSNYRLQVCDRVMDAVASVVSTSAIPFEILSLFISTFPQEFISFGGPLRVKTKKWLLGHGNKHFSTSHSADGMELWKDLHNFPHRFAGDISLTYDDEDLGAWESEANKWARVLFLVVKEECDLLPVLMFIREDGVNICKDSGYLPVKFFILILSLVMELQMIKVRTIEYGSKACSDSDSDAEFLGIFDDLNQTEIVFNKFAHHFLIILDHMLSYAKISCSVFQCGISTEDFILPSSVKGKLGGPSQRRLPLNITPAVLQGIISMKVVAFVSSWCSMYTSSCSLDLAFTFMWQFFSRTVVSPATNLEIGAELSLAAYEALAHVLKALAMSCPYQSFDPINGDKKISSSEVKEKSILDSVVVTFIENINNLLTVGALARTRRAVLLHLKWMCLESLLSILYIALHKRLLLEEMQSFCSGATLTFIFNDLVESLENAGEDSALPMLRSVRVVMELLVKGKSTSIISYSDGVNVQMMWHLVRSSWILHVSCNKRRVAPIAALLSAVLHSSVFCDEIMHDVDDMSGPLKWFVEKVIEEGTKSPRTIRLAALHLTGLWLANPRTIKYYMSELKLLSLYGSVAFDEDFETELSENQEAKLEVSLLEKSPDPELTEVFINTELYARVSVAVLFYKLAGLEDVEQATNRTGDCIVALEAGKSFLLQLLDSTVNDNDLAKELYKKYSAIHRRKIRAWQMLCVLSQFVDQDIVGKVTGTLHIALSRNNLPAVRQYLETFAINVYLKFPSLVKEQLVPILRDYDTRTQALSSYVFIAANVILHSSKDVQSRHLDDLFPPLFPLLTSHHHSLRGFTQLLVYRILQLFLLSNSEAPGIFPLEKRCFEDLESYLGKNSDCARLRASMGGYLDAYNPTSSVRPAGIFINRVEEIEFECVPTSLMDQVLEFLNGVRDDLRCSMAKDAVAIRNESLRINTDPKKEEKSSSDERRAQMLQNSSLDFQKKVTLSKHEKQENDPGSFFRNDVIYNKLLEMEEEDYLLDRLLHSRRISLERTEANRQPVILVASLLDRIPNLAGLARTCEVFRASELAIADKSILCDKQFQLISVTAEKWVPIIEVPIDSIKIFLEQKKKEGFSILGLEQTANSIPLDRYIYPKKTVLVLGREKEGIPVDIIHILDTCIEIPQLGIVRSLNVHVSGAIALWEYTRQQKSE